MPRRAVIIVDDLARNGTALCAGLLGIGVHARVVPDLADVRSAMLPPYPRAVVLITEALPDGEMLAYCREIRAGVATNRVVMVLVNGGAGAMPRASRTGPHISVRKSADSLKFLPNRIKAAITAAAAG